VSLGVHGATLRHKMVESGCSWISQVHNMKYTVEILQITNTIINKQKQKTTGGIKVNTLTAEQNHRLCLLERTKITVFPPLIRTPLL